MNERIEKLFDQALEEFKAENKYATIVVPDSLQRDFVEKFAELIVRECASKVDWIYAEKGITIDGVNFTVTQGDLIKQHFGFEE